MTLLCSICKKTCETVDEYISEHKDCINLLKVEEKMLHEE